MRTAPEVQDRQQQDEEPSRLRNSILDATVPADGKVVVAQVAKTLSGAVSRANAEDPAMPEARKLLDELSLRLA